MKIAVSSRDQQVVSGPACDCHSFLIYDTEEGAIKDKKSVRLTHSELLSSFKGALSSQPNHPLSGIEYLITTNLGVGMNGRLKQDGIKTIATNSADPDGAVISLLKYI